LAKYVQDPSVYTVPSRAVSLPAQDLSQRSPKGSHATFGATTHPEIKHSAGSGSETKLLNLRRASLPNTVFETTEPDLDHAIATPCEQRLKENAEIQAADKSFAASGTSNPKRRSKSADAFCAASRGHRMSPIQWRQWHRRSNEIMQWSDSVSEDLTLPLKVKPQDVVVEKSTQDIVPAAVVGPSDNVSRSDRSTFDFGALATSLQEHENVGIEERVTTLEVKLMDLEYAISKVQAKTSWPTRSSPCHHRLADQLQISGAGSGQSGPFSRPRTVKLHDKDTASAHYTHPALVPIIDTSSESDERSVNHNPTVRSLNSSIGVTGEADASKSRNRTSITNLTIDHYTTLIGIIRREQAARIRLEEQFTELQRQLVKLQHRSPQLSKMQIPKWNGETYRHGSSEAVDYQSVQSAFDHYDTDSEDGFQELFETPRGRGGLKGESSGDRLEGEAF
jgi:hypothetical protein